MLKLILVTLEFLKTGLTSKDQGESCKDSFCLFSILVMRSPFPYFSSTSFCSLCMCRNFLSCPLPSTPERFSLFNTFILVQCLFMLVQGTFSLLPPFALFLYVWFQSEALWSSIKFSRLSKCIFLYLGGSKPWTSINSPGHLSRTETHGILLSRFLKNIEESLQKLWPYFFLFPSFRFLNLMDSTACSRGLYPGQLFLVCVMSNRASPLIGSLIICVKRVPSTLSQNGLHFTHIAVVALQHILAGFKSLIEHRACEHKDSSSCVKTASCIFSS